MIDAHMHFWQLSRDDYGWLTPKLVPLYRDFLPHHAAEMVKAAGVDGVIAVQAAETEEETAFLCDLARDTPWIRGVVGWTDLAAPDAPSRIGALVATHGRLLKGLRPMLQSMADRRWIASAQLDGAIDAMVNHDLALDALVRVDQFGPLAQRATRSPALRIVIDHAGKPDIASGDHDAWAAAIAPLADLPQVYCKLSGLLTERGGQEPDAIARYVETLLALFGPDRLIWGSDHPVLLLAGEYAAWLDQACALAPYPQIFGANAARFYGLVEASRLLVLDPRDNVGVALADLEPGEIVAGDVAVVEAVPFGFKLATRPIAKDSAVIKYGVSIGSANCAISAGETVHLHNMRSDYTRTHTREPEEP